MQTTRLITLLRNFRRDQTGTTIVEFAVVAPVFFFMIFLVMEFGLLNFTDIVLETAVDQAGRNAMVRSGDNCARIDAFRTDVINYTKPLINSGNVSVNANPVGASGSNGVQFKPDVCLPANGPPTTDEDCPSGHFIENNGTPGYQGKSKTCNVGASQDIVELEVDLPYPLQFPFIRQLFTATDNEGHQVQGTVLLSARTVIRNE